MDRRGMDSYLQPLGSNILGRPISLGNVTTLPVGPLTHLTVSCESVIALVALSCIKYYNYHTNRKGEIHKMYSIAL